ncbi:gp4 [Streptomyces phage phiSASD1]|uniref:Gp4 n=1 Tax=Streptomyces phage phiSASD1 TaxID=747763 RepID=D7NW73_9CAUD|nr:gp4 [Streptomyces phage phiSASD1]ADE43471.1 gp4 [Streptomyces phage phiSASD1]
MSRVGSVVHFEDAYPVSAGHTLIIPQRHVVDVFEMGTEEVEDMWSAARVVAACLRRDDPTVTGFNVGFNAGPDAGQTVMHAHLHVIPRRHGDTPSPRGGVRGVIPGRMAY